MSSGQPVLTCNAGLTQRRKGTRRNAEEENSLRVSANLCASALNLRRLRPIPLPLNTSSLLSWPVCL